MVAVLTEIPKDMLNQGDWQESIWTNNKNSNQYVVTRICPNFTNGHEDEIMVLYRHRYVASIEGVREAKEFLQKFAPFKSCGNEFPCEIK